MRPPKGYNMGDKRIQNVGPARTSTVFDVVLLIASIIAGVVAWLIGMFLYNVLGDLIPRTLLIGIIFLLLYLILTAVVMTVSGVRGTLEDYVLFLDERWKVILFLVAGAVAVFGLGCLFQFRSKGSVGLRFGDMFRHSIQFDVAHFSNAGLGSHNSGFNTYGLTYGFRF